MIKSVELYDDGIGRVDYVSHMGSDLTVVNSARVSFGVEKEELDEKDEKLIKYLIRHKHTSTLEHNVVTFRFTVPLFVRSQHHRHRTWSYNEISNQSYFALSMRLTGRLAILMTSTTQFWTKVGRMSAPHLGRCKTITWSLWDYTTTCLMRECAGNKRAGSCRKISTPNIMEQQISIIYWSLLASALITARSGRSGKLPALVWR